MSAFFETKFLFFKQNPNKKGAAAVGKLWWTVFSTQKTDEAAVRQRSSVPRKEGGWGRTENKKSEAALANICSCF